MNKDIQTKSSRPYAHTARVLMRTHTRKLNEEDKQAIEDAETWLDTLCDYLKDSSSECIPTVKNVISKLKSLKNRV